MLLLTRAPLPPPPSPPPLAHPRLLPHLVLAVLAVLSSSAFAGPAYAALASGGLAFVLAVDAVKARPLFSKRGCAAAAPAKQHAA